MKKDLIRDLGKKVLLWLIVIIIILPIIAVVVFSYIINKMLYYKMILRNTVSFVSGVAIFAILAFLLKVSLVTSIFWGIAIVYFLLICSVENIGIKNEAINITTGAVSLVCGIIGIIFFNYLALFVGLIIYGVMLILLTLLKDFMNDCNSPENYEYPYD